MNEYLFKIPAGCPDLDYASLSTWMGIRQERAIGTTVTVVHVPETGSGDANFEVWLYETRIACVYPDRVAFPGPDDPHRTTTGWISKIIHDNAIGYGAHRIRRRKADGPGPVMSRGRAGLLVIGGRKRPVFGHTYPVGDIAGQRRRNAEWQAEWAAERERYAAESRRREALKTWTHPQYGPLYAIDGHDSGYHWRVVDSSFFDTIGYIIDTRTGPGVPSYQASPEPDSNPRACTFAAFTQDDSPVGACHELAEAIAAIAEAAKDTLTVLARARNTARTGGEQETGQ